MNIDSSVKNNPCLLTIEPNKYDGYNQLNDITTAVKWALELWNSGGEKSV